MNTAVAARINGDEISFHVNPRHRVLIRGEPVALRKEPRILSGGGKVWQEGDEAHVVWPDGSHLRLQLHNQHLDVALGLSASRRGEVVGLLGNYDGSPANDLATRDGVPVELSTEGEGDSYMHRLYRVFGDSWRISQAESLFSYRPGESTATFTKLDFPSRLLSTEHLSDEARRAAEAVCRANGIAVQPLLDGCILDVAVTGSEAFAEALAKHAGIEPPKGGWCKPLYDDRYSCEDDPVLPRGAQIGATYEMLLETFVGSRKEVEVFTCGPITRDVRASCSFHTKGHIFQGGMWSMRVPLESGDVAEIKSSVNCEGPRTSGARC